VNNKLLFNYKAKVKLRNLNTSTLKSSVNGYSIDAAPKALCIQKENR
jgi:hypothetical protein